MEEQKYLKRKQKATEGNNQKQLAEICNGFGDFYNAKEKYEDALGEYKQSAIIYEELGMELETGCLHRMVGEMYMLLAEFEKALEHEEIYLEVARKLNNKLEEQRALATLGRIFLLQGQSLEDTEESTKSLKAAEKAFTKSLVLCESLKGKISNKEFMDMRARLLLNIGVVLEHLSKFERAVDFLHKAIQICKNQDLYDLLYQCYLTEGLLYSAKQNDNAKALNCFNFALDVAGRLDNKILKQCEVLSLRADALCKMSDFHSAKSILIKAWKLKSPDKNEQNDIERKLKIVAAVCYSEDLLVTTNSNDYAALKSLYEKLGDGACSLKNYKKAIDFYQKMLENSEKSGDTGKELIPTYVSLYQTYKDIGNFEKALEYYKKEYELIQQIPNEAFTTLINIADILSLAGRSSSEVEVTYQQARDEARKDFNKKQEVKAMKLCLKYFRDNGLVDKTTLLDKELTDMGESSAFTLEDYTDSENETNEQNTPDIGDDICLENLTDASEENEEIEKPRMARKRGKGFTIKKNSKGETQLHQACISGNSLLVVRLISQGHPVNVRDNAGWLPLHEACIHGHKEAVETLLKHGAHVNDRGGTQCDGITPMYDAASNGFLEIVELLLNSGASPSIKTDRGETVLDILVKWRKDVDTISPTDHIFYETLCSRIHKSLEKIGECNNKQTVSQVSQKYLPHENNKRINLSQNNVTKMNLRTNFKSSFDDNFESCSKRNSRSESEDSYKAHNKRVNKRMIIEDEMSNSSDDTANMNTDVTPQTSLKRHGVSEYKNAMKLLRYRRATDDSDSDQDKHVEMERRKKGAILDVDEVGEDWLENDLVQSHKRKRNSFEISTVLKRKSNETKRKSNELNIQSNLSNSNSSELIIESNDVISNYGFTDNSLSGFSDTFEDIPITYQENIPPTNIQRIETQEISKSVKKSLSLPSKPSRKWKHQTSLLKSGFCRKRSSQPVVQSSSFSGSVFKNSNSNSMSPFKNSFSEEPDSTTEIMQNTIFGCDTPFSRNNLNVVTTNTIHPVEKPSLRPFHIPPTQQPAAVRVRVQDKLLLVPIMLDKVDSLTIDWFSKEVSRRYYNIEGVQPSLSLFTSDGAILANEDPLSLVIGSTEIQANIISWNLPPLVERYIECCVQFEITIDEHIRSKLETCQATHALSLPGLSLTAYELRPVFKCINHQANLTSILLPNNLLGNDGFKYLIQCFPSLIQLRKINLSGNQIDGDGIKNLLYMLEKPTKPNILNFLELDLSFNPIGDLGFGCLMKVTKYLRFKSLNIKFCDISSHFDAITGESNMLDLEVLDLSMNKFKRNVIIQILNILNPDIISELNLESLEITGEVIANFLENSCFSKLKKIDLSRCHLTDSDITAILRSATKCYELQEISLRYSSDLTILSLKKIIQQNPSFTKIDLEGCNQISKYLQETDVQENWFSKNEQCRIKYLKITTDGINDNGISIVHKMSQMWINHLDNKASVEVGLYGLVNLTEIIV